MSEKPTAPIEAQHSGLDGEKDDREASELAAAQAMLNEIMDRSMPKIPVPTEDEAPIEGSGPDGEDGAVENSPEGNADERSSSSGVSRETPDAEAPPPSTPKKSRSSVFTYLAVLFGAAFLMLLLAYFVQQRNNETTISGMQDSWNLSRQELVAENQRLEEENSALKAEQEKIRAEFAQEKQDLDQESEFYRAQAEALTSVTTRATLDSGLNHLERFVDARDWLMAATLVGMLDDDYNERNPDYIERGLLPSQKARYLELRETVLDKGKCMVIEGTATEDPSEYTEYPHIGQDVFDEEDLMTAQTLASAFLYYPSSPDIVSKFLIILQADASLERLNGGAFKPSTVALYEQVRADMIAAGALKEENGTLVLDPTDIMIP